MNNREGDTMKTLLFVFALTLSACGEEEATETEATSTTPVEQVEVQTTENVENGVEQTTTTTTIEEKNVTNTGFTEVEEVSTETVNE
tara:strand:+ start:2336 stop:2596 length:261 start_codon:yes stop_codon:yes gene_type:complete